VDSILSDQQSAGWLLGSVAGIFFFAVLILWSLVWKAIALWKSARRGDTAWYVVMTIVNTLGILEIIYVFAVAKDQAAVKSHPVIKEENK